MSTRIRRTLSYSLFEVCKILGPELTEADLIPTIHLFLKESQEVRIGVVQSLPEILAVLNQPTRDKTCQQM